MNEERMDMALEEVWNEDAAAEVQSGEFEADGGGAGADNTQPAPERPEAKMAQPAREERAPQAAPQPRSPKTEQGKQPSRMQQLRESARKRDMERFMEVYPGIKAADIPRQVWEQVARGVPMIGAYAMHENTQLKAQLAAERQNRANQRRTPGALSSNSGGELDEMDRMWAEDD